MADLANRLVGPVQLTAAAATYYTGPGATVTIIRHILFCNTNILARTVNLSIGADASGTRLFSDFSIAGNDVQDWSGFLVIEAGEILQAFASVATSVNLVVSGVEVT